MTATATRQDAGGLRATLLAEILRDSHRYVPGREPNRPTHVAAHETPRHAVVRARDRVRDVVERTAARAGFTRRHFDPDASAGKLGRMIELADGLEGLYGSLGDDHSRRALVDLLKLRVLGPYHAPLPLTPAMYRAEQARVDREMLRERGTFEISDPYFSPLSLYEIPAGDGGSIRLHSHSVDVVSVYVLNQYGYARGDARVTAEPGDVVLDVGGCFGDTALLFASRVGPEGKVYTFEFDPESLAVMRANLALNPELAERIEIVESALWDESGETLGFVQAGRMTWITDADEDANGRRGSVTTLTLDDFADQAGLERLDFVKMDVEGAELKVLAGGRESLHRFAPKLALAAYHKDDDLVRIPAAIEAAGVDYRLYLDSFSPLEDETVLFASPAASRSNAT